MPRRRLGMAMRIAVLATVAVFQPKRAQKPLSFCGFLGEAKRKTTTKKRQKQPVKRLSNRR